MKAIVISRFGGPEVLEVREFPDPTPKVGEVRVRVKASGLNFSDVMARKGLYPDAPKPPMIVGYEASGIVDELGEGVTSPAVGTPEGEYPAGVRLTKVEMRPIEARLERSKTLPKYDITIRPKTGDGR